jgi:hypothetical protein
MALLFVIIIFTLISPSISPGEQATSMHLIAHPVACKFSAICPFILAVSMNVII